MQKMYDLSSRYILCEMFSRVPRTVNYRGSDNLFFTRDFEDFSENFNASIVDYGFLWGHYYDDAVDKMPTLGFRKMIYIFSFSSSIF